MKNNELTNEEYQEILDYNNKHTPFKKEQKEMNYYKPYFNNDAYQMVDRLIDESTKVCGMMSYLTDLKIINKLKRKETTILTNDISVYKPRQQQILLTTGIYFREPTGDNRPQIFWEGFCNDDLMCDDGGCGYTMMHNKFLIFDDSVLVTGSLNLSGYSNSLDNIIVTNDTELIYRYEKQFFQIAYNSSNN